MDDYHVILLADDALDAAGLSREEALARIQEKKRQERAEHERIEAEMRAAMAGTQLGRD
jgi:hypothetical protein